jgi:hypothetical protein
MQARSLSTPGHAHVAQMFLMNYQHKLDLDHSDPVGSPMSYVLADDDRQMGK